MYITEPIEPISTSDTQFSFNLIHRYTVQMCSNTYNTEINNKNCLSTKLSSSLAHAKTHTSNYYSKFITCG